jgi:Tfp pilus assembly protein PilV
MAIARRKPSREDGESLIELIIAITILGMILVAIGACMAFTVKASRINRNEALADQYLHNYAEQLQSSYKSCSSAGNTAALQTYYKGLLTSPGGAFSTSATPTVTVMYWFDAVSPAQFITLPTCPTDTGLQQLTLNLKTADGLVSETFIVDVRKQS